MESDEQLYELSAKELAESPRQGLLIKCMAKSEGDENKGKALYIETRVKEMKDEIRDLNCPKCNILMEKRTATKGRFSGKQFWGCPNFPECWEKIVYKNGDDKLTLKEILHYPGNDKIIELIIKQFESSEIQQLLYHPYL